MNEATAGWYADPSTTGQLRWFDGQRWTEHVHAAAVAADQAPVQPAYAQPAYAQPAYAQPAYAQPAYAAPAYAQPAAAAQSAYAQPGYVQPGYAPQAFPAYGQATGALPVGCQKCGASPALPIVLREHHGLILMQRFVTYRGQFCRDCGMSQFRHAQSRTLLFGWWGVISFFMNIVAVFQNIGVYNKIRALAPPAGRVGAPLPQRTSVFVSPGFAVVVVALALLIVVKLA